MHHQLLKPCGLAAVCLSLCLSVPAFAADGEDDGPVTAVLGGRVNWDFASFNNDDRGTPNDDDTRFRRIWLDVSGKFYGFEYKAEIDLAGLQDEPGSAGIAARDVYITKAFDSGILTVGQFKQYFSLDDRTSSNYGQFLERGYGASNLASTYRKGVSWQAVLPHGTWAASAYSLETIDNSRSKGKAIGGRGTWLPLDQGTSLRHLGLSLAHEAFDHPGTDGAATLRVQPGPENDLAVNSEVTLARFNAGRDTDVDKWAVEYAEVRGPWSWQGEFIGGVYDDGAQRATVTSTYGFVSWFATGESRSYDRKTGRFGRIKSINHKAGALELALRYDRMDGEQHLIGGADTIDASTEAWTLGANWYLTPNLRLMVNLIDSRNRDQRTATTLDHTRAITGRFQYDF
ncbi:phosphate-selective porin OprO and OprP [Pseudoxanthomonas sp. GM95]|nr:phosphate-selective porin OprO and OprP [Pseudoxanthomonas sp. GM95]